MSKLKGEVNNLSRECGEYKDKTEKMGEELIKMTSLEQELKELSFRCVGLQN